MSSKGRSKMRQHYFCLTCGLDFCGRTAANGVIRAEDKGPTLANVPTPAYCIECAAKERNLLQRYPIDPTVLPRNLKPQAAELRRLQFHDPDSNWLLLASATRPHRTRGDIVRQWLRDRFHAIRCHVPLGKRS